MAKISEGVLDTLVNLSPRPHIPVFEVFLIRTRFLMERLFDKNSLFDGAIIGGLELCVKGKVSQVLVCGIHKVIGRLVGDRDG